MIFFRSLSSVMRALLFGTIGLAQRATVFMQFAPSLGEFEVGNTQAGGTQFPVAFLQNYPNDVHFAAVQSFQLQNNDDDDSVAAFRNLAMFWRYVVAHADKEGNVLAPHNPEVLESKSIVYKVITL
jgi:hypothetical protein